MPFDFARPFMFVFEDPSWIKKVLLGAVFQLLGIFTLTLGAWPFFGYLVRIARQVRDGNDHTLPEWEPGEDFGIGMRVVGIALVYMLPVLLIVGVGIGVSIGLGVAAGGDHSADDVIGPVILGTECLGGMVGIVCGLLAAFGVLVFIDTDDFGSAFRIGEIFRLAKDNPVELLLMIVVAFVANFLSQFGVILCLVGVLLTATWARYVAAHAAGQVLRIDRARRTLPPVPTTPAVGA